ncbi:MAG: gluconokinase [Nocardioidaceae bacterium]
MPSHEYPQHVVVMGVSGVGKTTVATALASRVGYEFAEADDFHPQSNIDKMSAGVPLNDEDRAPWLRALADWMRQRYDEGRSTVLACSALRRRYRDILREGAPDAFFVHLVGDQALLLARMDHRNHFMPSALLQSQFDTLEPLEDDENGVVLDVAEPPKSLVDRAVEAVEGARKG